MTREGPSCNQRSASSEEISAWVPNVLSVLLEGPELSLRPAVVMGGGN